MGHQEGDEGCARPAGWGGGKRLQWPMSFSRWFEVNGSQKTQALHILPSGLLMVTPKLRP